MSSLPFDTLDYFEKLKNAGVPEEQAKIQASFFRDFSTAQEDRLATQRDVQEVRLEIAQILKEVEDLKYATAEVRKETEGIKLQVEEVKKTSRDHTAELAALRKETEGIKLQIQEIKLQVENLKSQPIPLEIAMRDVGTRLIKWQFGIGVGLAALMAKGFGWLGF